MREKPSALPSALNAHQKDQQFIEAAKKLDVKPLGGKFGAIDIEPTATTYGGWRF